MIIDHVKTNMDDILGKPDVNEPGDRVYGIDVQE